MKKAKGTVMKLCPMIIESRRDTVIGAGILSKRFVSPIENVRFGSFKSINIYNF